VSIDKEGEAVNRLGRWILIGCLAVGGCADGKAASTVPASAAPLAAVRGLSAIASTAGAAVADVSGDAWTMAGRRAAGYLDIVAAEVARSRDGTFEFDVTLAAPLPAEPRLSEGGSALGWTVCIDVYPLVVSPTFGQVTIGSPCQFVVQASWDGAHLSGQLFDRLSVGAADPAVTLPFDAVVDGTSIRMAIPAAALGDPARFLWSMFTEELGYGGPGAAHHVDAAPDGGAGAPLAWPAD
jgi:hypothetical protein